MDSESRWVLDALCEEKEPEWWGSPQSEAFRRLADWLDGQARAETFSYVMRMVHSDAIRAHLARNVGPSALDRHVLRELAGDHSEEVLESLVLNRRLGEAQITLLAERLLDRAHHAVRKNSASEIQFTFPLLKRLEGRTSALSPEELAVYAEAAAPTSKEARERSGREARLLSAVELLYFQSLPVDSRQRLWALVEDQFSHLRGTYPRLGRGRLHQHLLVQPDVPVSLLRVIAVEAQDEGWHADLMRLERAADDPVVQRVVLERGFPQPVEMLCSHLHGEERRRAFRRLAEIAPLRAARVLDSAPSADGIRKQDLVPLLGSDNHEVRLRAISAMGRLEEVDVSPTRQEPPSGAPGRLPR